MDVPSLAFLGFAALAALAYNLGRAPWWRKGVLLVVNLLFLASFARRPELLIPFALFLMAGYNLLAWRQAAAPRWSGVLAVVLVLVAFFWLKKYAFVPNPLWIKAPYVVVGLSYVFFRVLHLVIDARDVEELGLVGPWSYLNYTLNFTSLISGPIQRYPDYRRTAETSPASLDLFDAGAAFERVVVGVFKVMVVSTALGAVQRDLLARAAAPGGFAAHAALAAGLVVTFPVFLYFNFSGYTDCVIGVARFFRIELPENFDRPFSSCSFIEYWSRWHMTLSNWLKTYVYNPLLTTLMRRSAAPKVAPYLGVAALFVTFFLIGAWHGQTAHFFIFGLLNGAGVAVNQLWRLVMTKRMGRKPFAAFSARPAWRFACRGATFAWVGVTLLWFWADGAQLAALWRGLGSAAWTLGALVAVAGAAAVLGAMEAARAPLLAWSTREGPVLGSRYVRTVRAAALVAVFAAVQVVLQSPAPDVVYKNF